MFALDFKSVRDGLGLSRKPDIRVATRWSRKGDEMERLTFQEHGFQLSAIGDRQQHGGSGQSYGGGAQKQSRQPARQAEPETHASFGGIADLLGDTLAHYQDDGHLEISA